jgi:hypothetical protein
MARFSTAAVAAALSLPLTTRAIDRTWDGENFLSDSWFASSNWNPDGAPAPADDATIGSFATASVNNLDDAVARSLTMTGSTVTVTGLTIFSGGGSGLRVSQTTRLVDPGLLGTARLIIQNGITDIGPVQVLGRGFIDIRNLQLQNGAYFELRDGHAVIGQDFSIDAQSHVVGRGNIFLSTSATGRAALAMTMEGSLDVEGGDLTIQRTTASASATLSLNATGGQSSTVNVLQGNSRLFVQLPVPADFNGTMRIGGGNSATFSQGFDIAAGGTLHLSGADSDGSAAPSVLNVAGSPASSFAGTIRAHAGPSELNAPALFLETVRVILDTNSHLRLNLPTTYAGGSYSGNGRLNQNADATVTGQTTIGPLSVYDWDGESDNSNLTVNPGAHLTLSANNLEPGAAGYDGNITLDSGKLAVLTPGGWRMDGAMLLKGAPTIPTLNGQKMELAGTLSAISPGRVDAPHHRQPYPAGPQQRRVGRQADRFDRRRRFGRIDRAGFRRGVGRPGVVRHEHRQLPGPAGGLDVRSGTAHGMRRR